MAPVVIVSQSATHSYLHGKFSPLIFKNYEILKKSYDPIIEADCIEENKLQTEYKRLLSSAKIPFNEEILNISQLGKYKDSPDRETRRLAFNAHGEFMKENGEKFDDIYDRMVNDKDCSIILTLAGSTSAAGCMQVYVDMVKNNMVDCIVSTGASIVDMDFFEALGFKHYKGTPFIDDKFLRANYVDRIYDTFIDEEELQFCDRSIKEIANSLEPRPYSSREFIYEMGKWL